MALTIKKGLRKFSSLSMIVLIVLIAAQGLNFLAEKALAENFTASVTVTNSTPTVSNLSIHYGASTLTIPEWAQGAGTYSVSTTFRVTDGNGWDEVSTTTVFVYRSGVAGVPACTSDINNCYPSTSSEDSSWNPSPGIPGGGDYGAVCARTATGTDWADFWCTTTFYYVAEATDADYSTRGYSGDYSGQTWTVYASTSDINWAQANSTDTIELSGNQALAIDSSSINYPSLGAGSNSVTDWQTTTVTTTGNVGIDVHFSGTNMTGAGTIAAGQQKFTTSSPATYGTGDIALTTTGETRDLTLSKPTTTVPAYTADDHVYWGIAIPSLQAAGSYSGTNTLTATSTIVYP